MGKPGSMQIPALLGNDPGELPEGGLLPDPPQPPQVPHLTPGFSPAGARPCVFLQFGLKHGLTPLGAQRDYGNWQRTTGPKWMKFPSLAVLTHSVPIPLQVSLRKTQRSLKVWGISMRSQRAQRLQGSGSPRPHSPGAAGTSNIAGLLQGGVGQ